MKNLGFIQQVLGNHYRFPSKEWIYLFVLKKKKKITPGAVLEVLWTKSETRETHEPLKLKMVML